MSKMRTYGQQVLLHLSADGSNFGFKLGEITSFSHKATPVVKTHSTLGETGIGSIDVLDNGGTLSFEIDKTDSTFVTYFALMEQHLRGGGIAGRRGKAPYLMIQEKITYPDESEEEIIYEGVVLHDDEGSVAGRTELYVEKMQGTYKKRKIIKATSGDSATSANVGHNMITMAMDNLINLSSNTTTGFGETTKVNYFGGTV